MFTNIIRSFFFIACIIIGGMWASYLVDEHNERAVIAYTKALRDAADESKKTATSTTPRGPSDGEKNVGAEGSPTAESGDGPRPESKESGHSEIVRYENKEGIPWGYVPFIVAFGGLCGLVVALLITLALRYVTQEAFERFFPALVSVLLAMATGWFIAWYILQIAEIKDPTLQIYIQATLVIVFFFVGVNLGLTRTSRWEKLVRAVSRKSYEGRYPKLLDTSVIIDGRIADICKAGFIEGTLIVPRFVLHELQSIADSTDSLRRARGRRGLDVLKLLQAPDSGVAVEVVEDDPQDIHTVDAKLVAFAKDIVAKVITNDQNLLKVAQIEGVSVMNIHDLANALKTVVLPDEEMQVRIVREGKEPQQGVGFLDDGTMVVVDGGRDHIGRSVVATVTSVLQTSNGRMIFTRLQSAGA